MERGYYEDMMWDILLGWMSLSVMTQRYNVTCK